MTRTLDGTSRRARPATRRAPRALERQTSAGVPLPHTPALATARQTGLQTARTRPGGRSARVRTAVFDATLALLREHGDAFGIPQVAERSGVHETSIYRRWGTRDALIVDAVRARVGDEIPVPDTGTLSGDLRQFLRRSAAFLTSPLGSQLVRATAPAPATGPAGARAAYWPKRLAEIRTIFDRASARGEIAASADRALATELLLAPLYFRVLVTRERLDRPLLERLASMVEAGLRGGGVAPSSRRRPRLG